MTTVYGDLVRYRELFGNLFRRDVQAKYRGSLLGVAWTLANPVLLMAVYLLVFSVLWKTRFGTEGHYALFLLVGLSAWIFFSTSLQSASHSMLDNANLIRKTRFPRQLVPLSIVATQLVSFAVMLVGLLALNFALLPRVRATECLAVPLALGVVAIAAGLALAISSLDVLCRRGSVGDPLDARQREPDPEDAVPAPTRAALGRLRASGLVRRDAGPSPRPELHRAVACPCD